jgi:RHS repeat-associated protein
LVRDSSGSLRAATLNERRADYDALPLAWASQEVDPDTGLTHYHFREYSPSLGGWLTRDPIGLAGGYLNLRSYLGNRPTDTLDAWGEVGNYLTMDVWMKERGTKVCTSSEDDIFDKLLSELLARMAEELEFENIIKNALFPGVRAIEGIADSAKEAYVVSEAAYRASIAHKSSDAEAIYYSTSYFVASFTGIRKLHGAISGETATTSRDGELSASSLSQAERLKYGAIGTVELIAAVSPFKGAASTGRGATSVRLGQAGEAAIEKATGLAKNTKNYTVNGRARVPDFVREVDAAGNPVSIIESKNVQYQSLTRQLRDYADLVGPGGRVDVALPPGARVSKALQNAFDDPRSPLFRMDLPKSTKNSGFLITRLRVG